MHIQIRAGVALMGIFPLGAQVHIDDPLKQAESLLVSMREAAFHGEGEAVIDNEKLLALAKQLDSDPRPGTSTKAAECRVWCLGLEPGKPRSAEAYFQLMGMYRTGHGVPRDEAFALELEKDMVSAIASSSPYGHSTSDLHLVASLLESGRVYPRDLVSAANWLFQAKDRGRAVDLCKRAFKEQVGRRGEVIRLLISAHEFPEALHCLDRLGPSSGLRPDEIANYYAMAGNESQAIRSLTRAAEDRDAISSRQLAWAYREGKGYGIKQPDGGLYLRFLNRAADLGDLDSMLELGESFWIGRFTPVDPVKAVSCFRRAGVYGKSYLAEALFRGQGVSQDFSAAFSLFREVYTEFPISHPPKPVISERLAQMYREGLGTTKDPVMAARFECRMWTYENSEERLEALLGLEAPSESWIELGATLKGHSRFGAAAKVFEKAMSMGSKQARLELGDLHFHGDRPSDSRMDEFQPDKEHGKGLLEEAMKQGVKILWQPLGFHYKKMDLEPSLTEDEEVETEPVNGSEWNVKAKRFETGDQVPIDPIRALYYRLCSIRDAPGC